MKNNTDTYRFDEASFESGQQIGTHTQPEWELTWIVRGSGIRTIGDRTETSSEGEAVLIPPGIPHRWDFGKGQTIESVTVIFGHDILEKMADIFSEFRPRLVFFNGLKDAVIFGRKDTASICSLLERMRGKTPAYRLGDFVSLIMAVSSPENPRTAGRCEFKTYIERRVDYFNVFCISNFAKPGTTLRTAAVYMAMTPASLCRFVKTHLHTTFTAYMNNLRLGRAAQLLVDDTMSVADVAYAAGFARPQYFHRVFRARYGCTPLQYRRNGAKSRGTVRNGNPAAPVAF